jgi:hypothetical protein
VSQDMKLIMENWNNSFVIEQTAIDIYDECVRKIVEEVQLLHEEKIELKEFMSKVSGFAKSTLTAVKELKDSAIKKVLETALSGLDELLKKLEDKLNEKAPQLISKVRNIINKLKEPENMKIAVSIISIIAGLLAGDAFSVLDQVLQIVETSDNILAAYETISAIQDTADMGAAVTKTGTLKIAEMMI